MALISRFAIRQGDGRVARKLDDPDHIEWEDAVEAIREWLAGPPFSEEILEVYERDPLYGPGAIVEKEISRVVGGTVETTRDRAFTFNGVKLRVKNAKGSERDAIYSFRFHWQGREWRITQPPAVSF